MSSLGKSLLILVAALAVVFAVVNRAPVTLSLWPAPFEIDLPLYLLLIATLALGVAIGGAAAWLGGASRRGAAREAERRAEALEGRVAVLERDRAASPRASGALPSPRIASHMDDE